MNPWDARKFIPQQYHYNTWYPGEWEGNKFDVAVNKRQFISVRKPCVFNIKDDQGNILRKQKGYEIYKQTKKNQWKYDGYELIFEEVKTI